MNIRSLTQDDFKRLIASEGGPHVSLFVPPPIASNDTREEDGIRFGNLLRSAHDSLTKYWMPETEAREFLRPLESLSREVLQANPRTYGVAIFLCKQFCDAFRVAQELSEQVSVARKFRVRPLLPCLEEPTPYALLTLSQHRVALFAATPTGLERVTEVMPEDFEKMEAELTVEPQTQVRASAVGGRHRQGVVFHGQGGTRDAKKVDLENYFKHVDHAVCTYWRKHPSTRFILAGVDSLTAMYRANSHCKNIIKPTLPGNVDHLSVEELQDRVDSLASDVLHERRQQKLMHVQEHDMPIATDPEQVLIAASEGRIDSLFVGKDAMLHGVFLADQRMLKEADQAPSSDPGDSSHDLIELAAVQTIKTGGSVYVVPTKEIPEAKRMVAGLRF